MRQSNITPERRHYRHVPSPTVMRAPIDQWHSLEFTFADVADTRISIANSGIDNATQTFNEARHHPSTEAVFAKMMEQFDLYERAIEVWLRSGAKNDKVKMGRLRGVYEKAVDEWYALQ